jgi:hypothetical protein
MGTRYHQGRRLACRPTTPLTERLDGNLRAYFCSNLGGTLIPPGIPRSAGWAREMKELGDIRLQRFDPAGD